MNGLEPLTFTFSGDELPLLHIAETQQLRIHNDIENPPYGFRFSVKFFL